MKTHNTTNTQQRIARAKAAIASAALVGALGGWLAFGSQSQTANSVAMTTADPVGSVETTIILPSPTTITITNATNAANTGTTGTTSASTAQANTGTASTSNQTTTTSSSTRQRGPVTTTRSSK